jgi:Domain of unknown function (DUF4386)
MLAVFAQGFIAERLIVSGDAAATAANILSHEGLFRLGFAPVPHRIGVSDHDDGTLL